MRLHCGAPSEALYTLSVLIALGNIVPGRVVRTAGQPAAAGRRRCSHAIISSTLGANYTSRTSSVSARDVTASPFNDVTPRRLQSEPPMNHLCADATGLGLRGAARRRQLSNEPGTCAEPPPLKQGSHRPQTPPPLLLPNRPKSSLLRPLAYNLY